MSEPGPSEGPKKPAEDEARPVSTPESTPESVVAEPVVAELATPEPVLAEPVVAELASDPEPEAASPPAVEVRSHEQGQPHARGSDEPLIRVENLTMGWDDFILQRDASFTIHRGDVFILLGGSGCGKSTLLQHMIGLQQPMSGSVKIAGLGDEGPERWGEPVFRVGPPPFGVMFQSGALFGSLTVGQNISLPIERWTDLPRDAIEAIVRGRLGLVGLRGFENHYPSEISGGMKKRAAIARALALEPELLFLDEPSAGLDPVSAVELDELILTLNRQFGLTVILVTHELESVFKIASRCVFLDKDTRSIIARGDPRELRDQSQDPRVRAFFNRLPREAVEEAAL